MIAFTPIQDTDNQEGLWDHFQRIGSPLTTISGEVLRVSATLTSFVETLQTFPVYTFYTRHNKEEIDHPLFLHWVNLISMCEEEDHPMHKRLEDIEVCSRWRGSFWSFLTDVGIPEHHRKYYLASDVEDVLESQEFSVANTRWQVY